MTPHEILVAGRELLSDPNRWTKGALARTKTGESVSPHDPKATCFCTMGAIHKVMGSAPIEEKRPIVDLLLDALDRSGQLGVVPAFNDHRSTTHDQILELWDKAIELASH